MKIEDYTNDWEKFRKYIEIKTKNRCTVTNKNWMKLRDYHFGEFIKTVPRPFGFIFKMIYMSKIYKEIPSIYKFYDKYKRDRCSGAAVTSFRMKTKASAYRKYR